MVLARRIAGHNIYWTCRLKLVLSPLPDISEFLWAPTWATTNDNQRPSKQTEDRIASFIPSPSSKWKWRDGVLCQSCYSFRTHSTLSTLIQTWHHLDQPFNIKYPPYSDQIKRLVMRVDEAFKSG